MSDLYSVDIPQGGSGAVNPGGAEFLGMRQELLRQAGLARQAQLDEQERAKEALQAEVARENIATSRVAREAQAQLNTEKANTLAATQFERTHGVGSDLTPADKAVALRLYGPGIVQDQPAMPADAGVSAEAPAAIAAPADELPVGAPLQGAHPAVPAKTTFAGTEEQQTKKSAKDLAHSILNGDYDTGDDDTNQEFKGWALSTLMTGKATNLPAGVVHPKTQSEKDSTRYFNTRASQKLSKPVSPEDVAFADSYEKLHPTEATKQQDALSRINVTVTAANTRQQNQFANASAEEAFKELDKDYKDLNMPRLQKLLTTLKSPGGVNDVVAVPEFLSALAGGQGAGLRMSQAELNMIQNARPLLDSLILKAGNIVGINKNGYAALTDQQRLQMNTLISEVAQHNYDQGQLYVDTQDKIARATSATEVRDIKADLARKQLELFGEVAGIKARAGAKDETPDQRRARIRAAAGLP